MERRRLGNSDLFVSRQGLGCMGMSDFYGPGDEEESVRVIHRALELGVNFLDTSDIYGPFRNERLLGKALKGRRDEVVLATKFGIVRNEAGEFLGFDGTPEYARKACEASLKRLGTDCIDLYYLHRPDPATPIEESVAGMADLVKEGKVRYIGLSEADPEKIRKARAVHPIAALQSEYSLWCRDPEPEVLPTCRELGIAFVPFSPLGRGFLTGAIQSAEQLGENDWRRTVPRFQKEHFDKNKRIADRIVEMAVDKGCSPAQLAIAWVMAQGEDLFPIPGTKRLKYLEENIAAASIAFSPEELRKIDESFPRGEASGGRFPEKAYKDAN